MPQNPPDNSILRNFTFAGILLFAVLGLAWWQREVITGSRICRVCAAESYYEAIYIHGLHIGAWGTETKAGGATIKYFDHYLGYPHPHEWTGRSNSCEPIGPGPDDPYPTHQAALTQMGLQLVAVSGIREPERRRRYFESIIRPADKQHYYRVTATWRMIHDQLPEGSDMKFQTGWIWNPDMEGVVIPDEVKAGGLLPDEN